MHNWIKYQQMRFLQQSVLDNKPKGIQFLIPIPT